MKECEEHNYGKWAVIQSMGNDGIEFNEVRSCTECGKSQIRKVDRIEV